MPGIAEALRGYGIARGVPYGRLCRAASRVSPGARSIVNLPGSTGGCRDAIAVLTDVLPHAVEQIRGGDHRPGGGV